MTVAVKFPAQKRNSEAWNVLFLGKEELIVFALGMVFLAAGLAARRRRGADVAILTHHMPKTPKSEQVGLD